MAHPFRQAAAIAAFAGLLNISTAHAERVGVASAVNPATFGTAPQEATRTIEIGNDVQFKERIKTEQGGNLQILFLDKSAVTVGPDAELTIDEFVYNAGTKQGKLSLSAAVGTFRFVGGALSKSGEVALKTPVATIGIRGGVVITKVAPDGATTVAKVFGGSVTVTLPGGQSQTITRNGFAVSISAPPGGANNAPAGGPGTSGGQTASGGTQGGSAQGGTSQGGTSQAGGTQSGGGGPTMSAPTRVDATFLTTNLGGMEARQPTVGVQTNTPQVNQSQLESRMSSNASNPIASASTVVTPNAQNLNTSSLGSTGVTPAITNPVPTAVLQTTTTLTQNVTSETTKNVTITTVAKPPVIPPVTVTPPVVPPSGTVPPTTVPPSGTVPPTTVPPSGTVPPTTVPPSGTVSPPTVPVVVPPVVTVPPSSGGPSSPPPPPTVTVPSRPTAPTVPVSPPARP